VTWAFAGRNTMAEISRCPTNFTLHPPPHTAHHNLIPAPSIALRKLKKPCLILSDRIFAIARRARPRYEPLWLRQLIRPSSNPAHHQPRAAGSPSKQLCWASGWSLSPLQAHRSPRARPQRSEDDAQATAELLRAFAMALRSSQSKAELFRIFLIDLAQSHKRAKPLVPLPASRQPAWTTNDAATDDHTASSPLRNTRRAPVIAWVSPHGLPVRCSPPQGVR
jgi:hypothetical protein